MAIADELIALLGYEIEGEELVRRYEQSLDRVNKRLTKFAETAGRVAGVATTTLATGFGLLGRSVVQTSAEFETYQATLETIEGSADKARQSLDWIAEFGKTTPYEVSQVTEAFVALKAYGIDPIANDALRTLGDTASAMGKPLMQAVEAFADAATGEFERLKEFGIRAKQQGDKVTFSWTQNGQEMTETVKKNSNDIRAFLLETMGDRFAGAMDRQSRTWTGMMSNLSDTWTDFKRRIGDAGFFNVVQGQLAGLLDWLRRLDEDGTLDRWAQNLSDALTFVANVFSAIATRIGENIMFLAENWEHLQTPMMIIGALFAFIIARAFPLITIFSFLALAIDDLLAYLQGGESIIGDFIQKLQDMTGVSEGVAQAIVGLGGTVLAALGTAFLFAPGKVIKIFGRLLFTGLAALAPLIMKGAVAAFALLSNPIGWAILLAGVAAGLVYYFWDELVAGWEWLSGKVGELATKFGDWFSNASWGEIFVRTAFPLSNFFWDELVAGWDALSEKVSGLATKFGDWLQNASWLEIMAAVVAPIPTLFINALELIFPGIKDRVVELFQGIIDWVMEIDWSGLGISMANAIWDGLKSVGESIKAWFGSLIPDWAKDWFADESEPAATTQPRQPVGGPFGQGLNVPATPMTLQPAQGPTPEQIAELEAYLNNINGNLANMDIESSFDAAITDARQDNRQFPFESNVSITQHVQQATDAPRAAAEATGRAVSQTAAGQRTQVETEPAF